MADGWKQGWVSTEGRKSREEVGPRGERRSDTADNEALPAPASRDLVSHVLSETSHTQKDEQRFHPHEARDEPAHRGGRQTRQYRAWSRGVLSNGFC